MTTMPSKVVAIMDVDALGCLLPPKPRKFIVLNPFVLNAVKWNVFVFCLQIKLTLLAFNIFNLNVFGCPILFNLNTIKLNVVTWQMCSI